MSKSGMQGNNTVSSNTLNGNLNKDKELKTDPSQLHKTLNKFSLENQNNSTSLNN